ncbi:MAG TPA: UvrD-helicase domain-containing protein [Sedimentisphaerales bacterium]|nr:UvrD-helicase domain-containing protein [Sedimentisphaerales bacterium]
MQDALYEQLTTSQREAVFHIEGPLLVLAGPGSGKTRVITYRIAALIDAGVRPHNICAITFTNKAASEMRQRAITLGASAGAHISTFHSLCVRILRRYALQAGVRAGFSVYDESDQTRCMKQAVKDCGLDAANFSPARMLEAVSALKNNLVDAEAFKGQADDFFSKTLAQIYSRYERLLKERNGLDFDDLLMKTAFLLERHSDVCLEMGNRFSFLLIDEYQDTNHAQYRIAKALVSGHNNICATGDPDQSIYRWRGADIRNILAFEKDWPDAVVVKLEENFRSTGKILAAADKLIAFNKSRKEKKLLATKPEGVDVDLSVFEDGTAEAQEVVQRIKELTEQGAMLRETAVFYRVNAMSRVLEEAFIRNKTPYQVVRGVEFYNRKEIRDVLAYLKVLVNPSDEVALMRIINTPARGIGKTTIERIRGYSGENGITLYEACKRAESISDISAAARAKITVFVSMMEQFKPDIDGRAADLIARVFCESGLQSSLEMGAVKEQGALENVEELINAAVQYDAEAEDPSLLDYLQQVALFSDADSYDASSERVALMTLHAAKGLEFENVFIIGLEDGLLPHERSFDDQEEMEEERRLLFVGMTRAKTHLNISWARYRTFRGQMLRTIRSQFLDELGIDAGEAHEQDEPYCVDDADDQQEAGSLPRFVAGQAVRHESFGIGRVKEYVDMGENSVVIVRFNTGQIKTLMVKYANLSKG